MYCHPSDGKITSSKPSGRATVLLDYHTVSSHQKERGGFSILAECLLGFKALRKEVWFCWAYYCPQSLLTRSLIGDTEGCKRNGGLSKTKTPSSVPENLTEMIILRISEMFPLWQSLNAIKHLVCSKPLHWQNPCRFSNGFCLCRGCEHMKS